MSYFLFITSDYKPKTGGVAAYIDSLARGLMRLGHRVKILAVVQPDEKEKIRFLENYEEWVSPLPIVHDERPRHWLGHKFVSLLEIMRCLWPVARSLLDRTSFFRKSSLAIVRLTEILTRERPSVIVLGYLDMRLYPLVLCLLQHRLPYGIVAHDFEVSRSPARLNDSVRRGMMLKNASWIAANSRHTKSLLEAWGISGNKLTIVHPPLSEQIIRDSADLCGRGQNRAYNLLTVCRLVKPKGVDIVLRALKILDEREIPWRYTIGGEGPERKCLEELSRELRIRDRVQFLGYVTEDTKSSLFRQTDVFVMTPRVNPRDSHEGFGIVFLEAAVFEVPAVGSRGGGIPEAILHGKTGLIVRQESPESLAGALTFLYQHPEARKAMGRAGAKRAITHFSPAVIAAQFQDEISQRTVR